MMGDDMNENGRTKFELKSEKTLHNKTGKSTLNNTLKDSSNTCRQLQRDTNRLPTNSQNGAVRNEADEETTASNLVVSRARHHRLSPTVENPSFRGSTKSIASSNIKVEVSPGKSRPQVTVTDLEHGPDLLRVRNYQIRSVKKGVPNIDPKDDTVQRIMMKKRDLKIIPYWICQRKKEGLKRNATAWSFSIFVTFVCVVFPLTSFSSDVAFYVTCSDHYNHTAEVLERVRNEYETITGVKSDAIVAKTKTNQSDNMRTRGGADNAFSSSVVRPAPLSSRSRRSLSKVDDSQYQWENTHPKVFLKPYPDDRNSPSNPTMPRFIETLSNRGREVNERQYIDQFQAIFPSRFAPSSKNDLPTIKSYSDEGLDGKLFPSSKASPPFHESNFEVEIQEYNETSCDPRLIVLNYMMTDEAPKELEAHRHVTVDIFEPVFILGSFPSLILCILTRLVVLVTGHKNFLSAYVINMACMPLQLITGALSAHSASYHLGRKGFECWRCALDDDCADMEPLWWLDDDVTQTLLVSILTKILDGMAGGLVLFVVIIRLLWPEGGHATFWWNTIRGFVLSMALISCISVSPLMVITPAMSVMRLEFMELATPFPGRKGISLTLTILMGLGLIAWGLSFAVLFIYVIYSMYMYCRKRTVDH